MIFLTSPKNNKRTHRWLCRRLPESGKPAIKVRGMKDTKRKAVVSALIMACLFSFAACGKKENGTELNKGETAKGTINTVNGNETSDSETAADNLESPEISETVVTETETDAMSLNEEGNIVVDAGNKNVQLTENGDGTGIAVITKEDGTEIEVAVKTDESGKLVVDTSKDITVTQTHANEGSSNTSSVKTSKLEVDKDGNVKVVTTTTPIPTATVKVTEASTPAPTQIPTVPEPTQPVVTSKPTSTPKPTNTPTPIASVTNKPIVTTAPTTVAACSHVNTVSVTETKTSTTPAWDEEVTEKVGTEECRGCGQYEVDFIEAWNNHDTASLINMYCHNTNSQVARSNLEKFTKENPNWIYENYDEAHSFFIDHCGSCGEGSNWGSCIIERVVNVIHHDAVTTTDEVTVGIFCRDCKTWIWREDGNLKAPAP